MKWYLMAIELEHLTQKLKIVSRRLETLENNKDQEIISLVEILANINFFGQVKKAVCQYARDGQCSLYVVDTPLKEQIPFTASCRVRDCKEQSIHSHIEISNITCGLCSETASSEPLNSNLKKN